VTALEGPVQAPLGSEAGSAAIQVAGAIDSEPLGLRRAHREALACGALLTADAVAVLTAIAVAKMLAGSTVRVGSLAAWLAIALWLAVFSAYGLQRRQAARLGQRVLDDFPRLIHAVLSSAVLTIVLSPYAPGGAWPAGDVALIGALALAAVPVLRAVTWRTLRAVAGPERVLLVGEESRIDRMARQLRALPYERLQAAGAVVDGLAKSSASSPPVLAHVSELEGSDVAALLRRNGIDRVLVAQEGVEPNALELLLRRCQEQAVRVCLVPQHAHLLGAAVRVESMHGSPALIVDPAAASTVSHAAKRVLDLLGAGLLLLVSAPLLALVAVAICLDTPGPPLFWQRRIGRDGRPFRLVKFRTMVAGAERLTTTLQVQSSDPSWLLLERDPRITRVGRILRLSSIDELPQLWNVLRGDMSLVGPRPLIEREDRLITGSMRRRSSVRPGLTGQWQVLGRTNIPFDEMLELDYLYVTSWSVAADVRLLLRTLPAVVMRRGAN
jgi:exopolysaccharide biosynthesis polyprenyl glycosylphosphotransferase